MARKSVWTNSDGLRVGFGTHSIDTTIAAAVNSLSAVQTVVVDIVGLDLADTDVARQLAHGVIIPANSYLKSATLFVTTAFAGASAVMDIGIYKASDGTAVADDGIDAAIATATLVDNYDVACDGSLIGTVLANNSKIGVTYDTAAFTAGKAALVVEYIRNPGNVA